MQRGLGGFPHERLHQEVKKNPQLTKVNRGCQSGCIYHFTFPRLVIAIRKNLGKVAPKCWN
ncbi:hypothetical protein BJP34_01675 [Moorena producens PAL-8-15-08-1]|uniref:Uncharacterized protein n=1 Tax=Moorena producens PAL-8-15-08-1 TaxID=1458985 RepID=A0A1D8TL37_9CYAN|nr:hypothetical protein BJP34_01675 [Moorena producens PAL-8-15-08-1]